MPTAARVSLTFNPVLYTGTITVAAATWFLFHDIVQPLFQCFTRHIVGVGRELVSLTQFVLDFGQFHATVVRFFAHYRRVVVVVSFLLQKWEKLLSEFTNVVDE